MAARSRVKTTAIEAPRTKEEAEVLLSQIGHLQRQLTDNESSMNKELTSIKERFGKRAEQIKESIDSTFKRLHTWAEANKPKLLATKGKKTKTASLSTGNLVWRKTPPKVNVKKTEDALAELKEKGLTRFIRTEETIDKEAILKERDAIKDLTQISVSQRTEFVAKPHETNIEKVAKSSD